MECNKDEAVRAKEIAEKMILERDITGAKKFALKAQNLFPKLDGLSQFLEIIDVYAAHEKKKNGEADYYGIFGVDPFADEEVLKKQYKRMALSLHPDKNKSVGADGAFKIMSQAWSVLSDKDKRSAYNLKLNIRASNQTGSFSSSSARYKPPATNSQCMPNGPRTKETATGQQNTSAPDHPRTAPSETSSQHIPSHQQTPAWATASKYVFAPRPPFYHQYFPARNQPTPGRCPSGPETFWTSCNGCRIQLEYQKIYLNQNLLCPSCEQPFWATEMPVPNVNNRGSRPWSVTHQQQDISTASSGSRSVPDSARRTSQGASRHPSGVHLKRRHGGAVNLTRDNEPLTKTGSNVPEKVQADSASSAVSSGLTREKPVKKRCMDGQKCDGAKESSQGTAGSRSGLKRTSANLKGNFGAEQQSRSVKELSQSEVCGMLMEKAKMEIISRLNEWETQKSKSSYMKEVEMKDSANAFKNNSSNYLRTDQRRDGLSSDPKNMSKPQRSSSLDETDDIETNLDETVSMTVPDANFHNFDDDRVEDSFTENQVWAAYDDDDGMPRYYAVVHQVISRKPFKIRISWLNSKSSSEFGSLDWIGSGFTKTSGDFRVGKFVVNRRLNSFSHPVKCRKGAGGVIQIFPTKGDVWALYRNWSADWDEVTADETIHKYDLVVVLEDYNEDMGVSVAPLVKVAGFTSVFYQLSDLKGIQKIPREEMFRFSHQVPFYMLNGLEAENVLKGSYELDPAALPMELLKVITDAEAEEQRVSEHPVMLRGPELEHEIRAQSTSAGKTHATEEKGGVEDAKYIFTYCRRNKGRRTEGAVDRYQR